MRLIQQRKWHQFVLHGNHTNLENCFGKIDTNPKKVGKQFFGKLIQFQRRMMFWKKVDIYLMKISKGNFLELYVYTPSFISSAFFKRIPCRPLQG